MFLNVCKQIFHISHVLISEKSKRCYNAICLVYLCSYEDEDMGKFSNLHQCTFKGHGEVKTVQKYYKFNTFETFFSCLTETIR